MRFERCREIFSWGENDIIYEGVHLSFDREVSRWRYADFSFTRLKSVYKSKVGEDFAARIFYRLIW